MNYVPLRKAREILGLSDDTLRKLADNEEIRSYKSKGGHRYFDVQSYIDQQSNSLQTICYCRVSSIKQKDDLNRQVAYLQSLYPESKIITDIASGVNFKRKGLLKLLELAMQGNKLKVVVAYKDRLARIGFDLIKYIIEYFGGQVLVCKQSDSSPNSELIQDVLAILHSFSAKVHGLRKYSKKIKEDRDLSFKETTKNS